MNWTTYWGIVDIYTSGGTRLSHGPVLTHCQTDPQKYFNEILFKKYMFSPTKMHWKIPSGKRWLFELQSYLSYKSLRLCNGLSPGIRADTATFESTLRQTLQMEPHHVTGNSFFQVLMVSFDAGYCGGVVAGRDQHLLPCSQFTILNTAHGDSPNIWNTMLT